MLCAMRSWSADEWPAVRARGKNDFLLRYGFLRRGLPLGVVVALAIEGGLGSEFPDALSSTRFLLRLVLSVAVLTLSGCISASFTWNVQERRFAGRA
jgi:hypothetical protein